MDELAPQRQEAPDHLHGARGIGLEASGKVEVAGVDREVAHERRIAR
jgi:hypothetical protein